MPNFTINDAFQFAFKIEEDGEKFYHRAAEIAEDEEVKKIFENLAEEENEHNKTFENMFSRIDKQERPKEKLEEYLDYLNTLIDEAIFTDEALEKNLSEIKDTSSAIKFAVQRELDTILFFHELKNLVPGKQHDFIDEIIDEEREHYIKLIELNKKYREKSKSKSWWKRS